MGAGTEPHSGMWIVVSVTSAIWTASLPAIVPGAITDRHGIGITAANGRGTVMAMATGIAALAGAPHLIIIVTEEIGRQPVIPLITAGKPESRTRKSGHSGNPGARRGSLCLCRRAAPMGFGNSRGNTTPGTGWECVCRRMAEAQPERRTDS